MGRYIPSEWNPLELDANGWYDASDEDTITEVAGAVSQFDDKSGNGHHLVQATGSKQPMTGIRTLNGLNVLDGNGLQSMSYQIFPVNVNGDVQIIGVLVVDAVNAVSDGVYAMNNVGSPSGDFKFNANNATQFDGKVQRAGDTDVTLTGGPFPGPSIYNVEYDATGSSLVTARIDGTDRGTAPLNYALNPNQDLTILADKAAVNPIDGAFAELVILDDVSIATRQFIEGYLAWKWGIQANLPISHPFRNSAPLLNKRTTIPVDKRFAIGAVWDPSKIDTEAWYDASDEDTITEGAGSVSQWNDKSSNSRDISQAVGADQPSYAGNTISFDGISDHLWNSSPFMWDNGEINVFMVAAVNDTGAIQNLMGEGRNSTTTPEYRFNTSTASGSGTDEMATKVRNDASTNLTTAGSGISDTGPFDDTQKILMYRDTGSQMSGRVNGGAEVTLAYTRSGVITLDRFAIGGVLKDVIKNAVDMDLNEVVITSDLSTDDRQKMEGYLAWKWGLEANLPSDHPYKSRKPYV